MSEDLSYHLCRAEFDLTCFGAEVGIDLAHCCGDEGEMETIIFKQESVGIGEFRIYHMEYDHI